MHHYIANDVWFRIYIYVKVFFDSLHARQTASMSLCCMSYVTDMDSYGSKSLTSNDISVDLLFLQFCTTWDFYRSE